MAALRRKRQASKKEENLEELVRSGEEGAYTALQLYRSRALRYQSKSDIGAALKLAASGARLYLECSEANKTLKAAGAELATLLLSFLTDTNLELNNDTHTLVTGVDDAFTKYCPDMRRVEFLKNCIKWAQASGSPPTGLLRLHQRHAESLWDVVEVHEDLPPGVDKEIAKRDPYTNKYKAIYPFVAGEAPDDLCDRISESFGMDKKAIKERDRILTTSICHFLALENLRDANRLMSEFKRKESTKGNPIDTKLMIFCDQLLQVCRRDATDLFKKLVNSIKSEMDWSDKEREKVVQDLLTGPIGYKFFGIQPKVNPMMQMMQRLLA